MVVFGRDSCTRIIACQSLGFSAFHEHWPYWIGPFIMASYNTRIVRRSNALLGWAYGRAFRYHEVTDFGARAKAPFAATGMAVASAIRASAVLM